ncbi:hypothetical protein M758_2G146600 [Ceratodon purpureus]|nr:hypothetical protein M758_2G146600 [Ceratodon purpureus]
MLMLLLLLLNLLLLSNHPFLELQGARESFSSGFGDLFVSRDCSCWV